jgi:MFS family permease
MSARVAVATLLCAFAGSAHAQAVISRFVVGSGGTQAASTSYALVGTAGQPAVGGATGASFQVVGGFWASANPIGTGVETPRARVFRLEQNYPNPFNPRTTIAFAIPSDTHVRLHVFDATGVHVMTVIDRSLPAGAHRVELDASGLASGVYFYRLEAPGFQQARKLVLLK